MELVWKRDGFCNESIEIMIFYSSSEKVVGYQKSTFIVGNTHGCLTSLLLSDTILSFGSSLFFSIICSPNNPFSSVHPRQYQADTGITE